MIDYKKFLGLASFGGLGYLAGGLLEVRAIALGVIAGVIAGLLSWGK